MDTIGGAIAFFVGALLVTFALTRAFNFLLKKIKIKKYEYLSFIFVSAIGILVSSIKMGRFSGLPYLACATVWLLYDLRIHKKINQGIANHQSNELSGDLLVTRASAVLLVILDASFQIQRALIKNLKCLNDLKSEEERQVLQILTIVLLAHAQKLYWERFISDEEAARKFEIALYGLFYRNLNIDPIPYIKDFAAYISRIGDHGQFQYVGSKICSEILMRDDGVVMHQIGRMFGNMLPESFIQPLIKTREVTLADSQGVLAALVKYKEYFNKEVSEKNTVEGGGTTG